MPSEDGEVMEESRSNHLFIMFVTTDFMLLLFQRYGPPLQDVVRDLETGEFDVNSLKDSLIGMHATSILDGCGTPHSDAVVIAAS